MDTLCGPCEQWSVRTACKTFSYRAYYLHIAAARTRMRLCRCVRVRNGRFSHTHTLDVVAWWHINHFITAQRARRRASLYQCVYRIKNSIHSTLKVIVSDENGAAVGHAMRRGRDLAIVSNMYSPDWLVRPDVLYLYIYIRTAQMVLAEYVCRVYIIGRYCYNVSGATVFLSHSLSLYAILSHSPSPWLVRFTVNACV